MQKKKKKKIGILSVNKIWLTTWLGYVLKSDHKTDPSEKKKICFVGWLVGLYQKQTQNTRVQNVWDEIVYYLQRGFNPIQETS